MAMFAGGKVIEKLGVRPVINAMGNGTVLGGSTPPPAVRAAMEEANESWVEMQELLEKAGDYIAGALGVEAAYVTSGCAAALTLSTAACMAGTDPDKIGRLPDTTGMKSEILIQKRQRYGFDRCFTFPGGRLLEVEDENGCTAEQLEDAIGPNTAAVAYFIQPELTGSVLSLEDAVNAAHKHDVSVIVDAASQIYPLDYFRECAQSADLVCFGAMYFGAPHSSGIVCGRRDLVQAVVAQGFIAYHLDGGRAFGRAMKLDRQEIVGAVAALDSWFSMNHEDRFLGYDRKMSTIQQGLAGVSDVRTVVQDNKRFWGSSLHVTVNYAALGKNAADVVDELDAGNPRIWVRAESDDTIAINVHTLNEGEDSIVAERLREILSA